MHRFLAPSIVSALLLCPATAGAQTPPKPPEPKPAQITMSGCLRRDQNPPNAITFLETESGEKFQLTGKSLSKYAGQHVEIVGAPPGRKLKFRFGLWPSPNVAAQAGAMDPVQAAMAGMPGGAASGVGGAPLPEFHVVGVKPVTGVCE